LATRAFWYRYAVNFTTWNAEEGTIREGEPREWEGKGLKHTIRAPWVTDCPQANTIGQRGEAPEDKAQEFWLKI
jgi:hypothetical protein